MTQGLARSFDSRNQIEQVRVRGPSIKIVSKQEGNDQNEDQDLDDMMSSRGSAMHLEDLLNHQEDIV